MRLSSSKFHLPAPLVTALEQTGYTTSADLLFSGSAEDIFCQLPPNTIGFNEFEECLARVLEASGAQGSHASSLLHSQATPMPKLCLDTGVDDLDELLMGLGGGSTVIEISGDIGSGKSMLATHIALRHLASDPDAQLLWIDTTGNFLVDQVAALLARHSGQGVATALARLHLSLAFDLDSAYQALHGLRHPSCVVIDSITPLLGPALSAVSAQGHALMVGFMRHLRAIAQSSNASVLVINNSTSNGNNQLNPNAVFPTTRKPALGPSFPFLTDATLWLTRRDSTMSGCISHTAEIWRSKTTSSKRWCAFQSQNGFPIPPATPTRQGA
ncbi:hypothetical protein PC9H_007716 [Pleurotus ostreatus]|uniref:Rad51-like C-terminal domain-containing protein n=1 Tax=Pleurotus ostreatus TaxID=5322 RepID=A0A8H7DRT5_PLEOS|nr:uncharacterized protein PC9H_007716 [Pleurotus ostreatus]KAF7428492.1 hypothetical protein PC9H_007716 [Pleurotus ostreatus]KAJ8696644.1 hypothetical protein PTI98_006495 [Pleurotus ostreatus]